MSPPSGQTPPIDDAHTARGDDLFSPQGRAVLLRLRADKSISHPHTLEEFRQSEGREKRKRMLIELWKSLPEVLRPPKSQSRNNKANVEINAEEAKSLKETYDNELLLRCASPKHGHAIEWTEFKKYAEAKETELWQIFHAELDLDGNGQIDEQELSDALGRSGIQPPPSTIQDFIASVSSQRHSPVITFDEFRNFFILLPRKVSPTEIYHYYEMRRYLGDDGRGPARVNMEGDVSLSAEDKPPSPSSYTINTFPSELKSSTSLITPTSTSAEDDEYDYIDDDQEPEEPPHHFLDGHTALKFLFAGGVAGAVSRTCTAPFDRLKIFLITRPPELGGPLLADQQRKGLQILTNAVARIYAEGGLLAFWTGNGLSVAKIFPESAIKFFAYESSKRAFAKYYDKVEDSRDISGLSRFLSGGVGGISSQLSIYPIETLKTQMMSNTGQHKRTLLYAMRHIWALGGVRRYYRGLTIGLVGVFPYSAIDMSTFEALKQAYQRSTGTEEPGVLALLAFGSISGSVGATSVYPLNLVRTRLQASGSSGHPQTYTGPWDVATKTWAADGWRGFYRGLFPTLAKVVPAVSISYVVYEHTKRRLGV